MCHSRLNLIFFLRSSTGSFGTFCSPHGIFSGIFGCKEGGNVTDGGVRPQLGWGGVWGGEGRWRLVLLMRPERFHKEITEKRMIRYRPGSYCTSDACVCMEESIRFMFEASYIRIHTRFDVRLVHITYTYCTRRVERLFDLFGVEQNKRHHENFVLVLSVSSCPKPLSMHG